MHLILKLNSATMKYTFLYCQRFKLLTMLFFTFTIQICFAQQAYDYNLIMKTASLGNEGIIRWAPIDFQTWKLGNSNGYKPKRVTISQYNVPLSATDRANSQIVLDSLLKPISEASWESMADTSDLAGVAAGSIGRQFRNSISGFSKSLYRY